MTMSFGRPLAALSALLCPLLAMAGSYEDRGYALLASYTGESAFLVDGGKQRGSAYAGQFFVGAEADAGRPFGGAGAKLKLYIASRHGDNLAIDEIGNSVSVQEIWGAQTERLANLTIEQKLLDDRVIVEAGRTVANIHFLGSELCNYFQTNSACGNPTFVFRTSGFTYWPVSSWGGYVKAFLTPQVYVHAGVFEINPLQARENQHGLNWGIADATGVIAPIRRSALITRLNFMLTTANGASARVARVQGWVTVRVSASNSQARAAGSAAMAATLETSLAPARSRLRRSRISFIRILPVRQ